MFNKFGPIGEQWNEYQRIQDIYLYCMWRETKKRDNAKEAHAHSSFLYEHWRCFLFETLTPIITYNSALLLSLDSNHLRRAELYVIIAVSVSIRKHLQCSYGEEACACASLALSRFHVSLHIRYERRGQLKDVAN